MMCRAVLTGALLAVIGTGQAFADDEAMVEAVQGAPKAGVAFLDSLPSGQTIDLGSSGVLKLTYLDTCRTETIHGGMVTIGQGISTVAGGTVEAQQLQCSVTEPVVTSQIAVAGAAVKRVTPFDGADWREVTVKSKLPTFRWTGHSAGSSSVSVYDLEQKPAAVIWSAESSASWIAYPRRAPALVEGEPYRIEVKSPDGSDLRSVFTVDTHLDVPNTLFYRVVSVGR